jgi:hypothetical protein
MDKKELTIFFTLSGISILFAISGLALYLSKGKSKFWTAKKIKLGAAILTLSTVTPSCRPFVSCYEPTPPENSIYLNIVSDTIRLNDTTILNGYIENRVSKNFSFVMRNIDSVQINQTENITAKDGAFDEYTEEFSITIDSTLNSGDYSLKLFSIKKEDVTSSSVPENEYQLKLVKGR